ncbi:MAG: hypothetical protein LUC30_06105 [Clostridiales bacterium]|nr:hypothetical protein [Clostridiales bacterium]
MNKRGFSLKGWDEKGTLERVLLVVALCDGVIAVILTMLQLMADIDTHWFFGPMYLIFFLLMAYEDRRDQSEMVMNLIWGGILLVFWLVGFVL